MDHKQLTLRALFVGFLLEVFFFPQFGQAAAPTIDMQFSVTGTPFLHPPAYTGAAVAGAPGDFWNNTSGAWTDTADANFGQALLDVSGNATSVTADTFYSGAWGTGGAGNWAFDGTPYAPLMDQYVYGYSSALVRATLRGLTPGSYDLYLYSDASPDASKRVDTFTVTGNGIDQTANVGPTGKTNQFVEGTNYLHFQTTVGDDGTLGIVGQPGSAGINGGQPEVDLSGFQLVPAPEPQCIGLLGIAAAALMARRRRQPIC